LLSLEKLVRGEDIGEIPGESFWRELGDEEKYWPAPVQALEG